MMYLSYKFPNGVAVISNLQGGFIAALLHQRRERNEVGLHIFIDQLKQLLSQIVHENGHILQN